MPNKPAPLPNTLSSDPANEKKIEPAENALSSAERAAFEKKLTDMTQALHESNRELELFASTASHDLQEPLHIIATYTEILAQRYKGKLDEEADEIMTILKQGAYKAQLLIRDLSKYARLGIDQKTFASVNTAKVFKTACDNLRLAAAESGAVITHDPLPSVWGDESQLVQLFQNLIANAVKFRKPGLPSEIRVSVQKRERDYLFSVSDNGIGIDPKYHERIFNVFTRLHGEKFSGTGLGLALCKKIAGFHGSPLQVKSELGQGACFSFSLLFPKE